MSGKTIESYICLKEYISEKNYKEIKELEEICSLQDKVNLKLELDYKLNINKASQAKIKNINEFLYYVDDVLVSYLGISSFGGNIGEINGMTHPEWRRRGLFKRILELAIEQCSKINFTKVVLLSDGKSTSGIEFIKNVGGEYDFSEYRMKLVNNLTLESTDAITLRKAEKSDAKEMARQNSIYFNRGVEVEGDHEEEWEEMPNQITYMVELKGAVIGKITVEYEDDSAFICGFGILPEFRGKGYGKATLKETLRLITLRNILDVGLDVEARNSRALNLYKTCGFEEVSVMNYYKYKL